MKTTINNHHQEHADWTKRMAFYRDEIRMMQNRLEEVNAKNTAQDVKKKVEHFQNQLIVQQRNTDDIAHRIRRSEQMLEGSLRKDPSAIANHAAGDHASEREQVESFESNFNGLRKEFNAFLAERL